eukprot:SAG11_NODE_34455_length_272_cov_0.537572_1_plen_40_part_01
MCGCWRAGASKLAMGEASLSEFSLGTSAASRPHCSALTEG